MDSRAFIGRLNTRMAPATPTGTKGFGGNPPDNGIVFSFSDGSAFTIKRQDIRGLDAGDVDSFIDGLLAGRKG